MIPITCSSVIEVFAHKHINKKKRQEEKKTTEIQDAVFHIIFISILPYIINDINNEFLLERKFNSIVHSGNIRMSLRFFIYSHDIYVQGICAQINNNILREAKEGKRIK